MTKKTRIVAKIADNKSDPDFLKELFAAGADVAWLNTAHQDEAGTLEVVERIRKISPLTPILLDTKGPEIRTKGIENNIEVEAGDYITFTGNVHEHTQNVVHVSYHNFEDEIPIGTSILYDDASIELIAEERTEHGIKCRVQSAGAIKNKKSLNVPGVHIHLPALSEKDASFIHFCAKNKIDFIIHSFVRSKEDIFEITKITDEYPDYKAKIIAKIENREGFNNVEEILDHCDGLMVARGDLGAEVPLEELPYMQKKMIESCLRKGKYCINATQVLDSMIKNPRPTRAEVTDVANAVLDGAGGISLSGETAYGHYPIQAVSIMKKIMDYTERKRIELIHFKQLPELETTEYKAARQIVATADEEEVSAIIVDCENIVDLARAISAYRPRTIVVPVCKNEEEARDLTLGYGVYPILKSETSKWVNKGAPVLRVGSDNGEYNYKVDQY